MPDLLSVAAALRAVRYSWSCEEELQAGIAEALTAAGFLDFEREADLGRGGRLDFLDRAAGIGVEVKTQGSPAAVARQLLRYLALPEITGLVLVTSRRQVAALMPASDRLAIVSLWEGGLR